MNVITQIDPPVLASEIMITLSPKVPALFPDSLTYGRNY